MHPTELLQWLFWIGLVGLVLATVAYGGTRFYPKLTSILERAASVAIVAADALLVLLVLKCGSDLLVLPFAG